MCALCSVFFRDIVDLTGWKKLLRRLLMCFSILCDSYLNKISSFWSNQVTDLMWWVEDYLFSSSLIICAPSPIQHTRPRIKKTTLYPELVSCFNSLYFEKNNGSHLNFIGLSDKVLVCTHCDTFRLYVNFLVLSFYFSLILTFSSVARSCLPFFMDSLLIFSKCYARSVCLMWTVLTERQI